LVAVLVLALIALALFIASWVLQRTTGVRVGTAVAELPLADEKAHVRGRLDYLVRERAGFVPIELKPLRRSTVLYESDRVQLGVYLLLTRANYPREFAGYGRVRYREAEFTVTLDAELEARCLALAERVRAARRASDVHRTHEIPGKCGACRHREACGENLV
jgi:CRISPR/Cas system-associated exonuclease Cas4 (RecB family)